MARGGMATPHRPAAWVPLLVLLAAAAFGVAVWLLFPRVMTFMQRQDCIASGHVNCDG